MADRTKVVFVRPANLQKSGLWKKQGVIRCPLNLGLLASYIRENGEYECSIVDFEVTEAYTNEDAARIILEESPRYVCITTLTPRYPTAVRIATVFLCVITGGIPLIVTYLIAWLLMPKEDAK